MHNFNNDIEHKKQQLITRLCMAMQTIDHAHFRQRKIMVLLSEIIEIIARSSDINFYAFSG